jgi:hypothetical protein
MILTLFFSVACFATNIIDSGETVRKNPWNRRYMFNEERKEAIIVNGFFSCLVF